MKKNAFVFYFRLTLRQFLRFSFKRYLSFKGEVQKSLSIISPQLLKSEETFTNIYEKVSSDILGRILLDLRPGIILENSPGFLQKNHQRFFHTFFREILKKVAKTHSEIPRRIILENLLSALEIS